MANQHTRSTPAAFAPADSEPDAGLSVKYGLTSSVTLEGTVNPDFSQVESDAFQVELSILQLFQYPTIRSLAKFFSEEQKEKLPLQKIRDRARRQRTAFDGRRRALEALT